MKSVMGHSFSQVPTAEIQRSKFNRSCGKKITFNAGALVPMFVDEVLPGDTFNLKTSAFARMSTPIYPIMDNLYMDTFYFFVPCRLLWDNWEKFMGAQDAPGDSTDYLIPQAITPQGDGFTHGSLQDYMGLVPGVPNYTHNALPLRAYNLIWNEWFRDQNLQQPLTVETGDGPDQSTQIYALKSRGKRHDYFTSCLPWPQKGQEVQIPLAGAAPVFGTGTPLFSAINGEFTDSPFGSRQPSGLSGENMFAPQFQGGGTQAWKEVEWGTDTALEADLSSTTAATINQLRQAFQVQKFLERDARGGTRYVEMIKAHFNVTNPDFRLQRPEYLGGGSTPINITPIANTANIASVGGDGTVGELGAMGTANIHNHGFTKSFTEHGYIIGLVNVRSDLTYQQGINRLWSRETRLDFYFPVFAHLGEQAVLNKEIYVQDPAVTDPDTGEPVNEMTFGFQERYAEYRYKPSEIAGQFRSSAEQSLDPWHLSQDFSTLPLLNDTFIRENPPMDRVLAVPTEPDFIADFYHDLKCARPMPMYGIPGNIDRF